MEVPALSTESTPTRRGWYAARALGNRTLFHTVMVLISLVYVVPLVWMVLSSFKTKREIFDSPFALPTNIDLGVWVEAWDRGNLGQYVDNSLITTTASVSAILLFGLAAAYAFSRFRFRFSVVLLAHFVLGLLLPVQSYLTAQSRIFDAFYLKVHTAVVLHSHPHVFCDVNTG